MQAVLCIVLCILTVVQACFAHPPFDEGNELVRITVVAPGPMHPGAATSFVSGLSRSVAYALVIVVYSMEKVSIASSRTYFLSVCIMCVRVYVCGAYVCACMRACLPDLHFFVPKVSEQNVVIVWRRCKR